MRYSFSYPLILTISGALWLGCGSDDGDDPRSDAHPGDADTGPDADPDTGEDAEPEPEELALDSRPGIMEIELSWEGADRVDIAYSSDPFCDWDTVANCSHSGRVTGASGGAHTLAAIPDGLSPDRPLFFVAEAEGDRSEVVGGRPLPPGVSDEISAATATSDVIYLGLSSDRDVPTFGGVTGGAASFDAETGALAGGLPHVRGEVEVIAADPEGGFYLGGDFDAVGETERRSLARLTAQGAVDTDFRADVDGEVSALALRSDRLYVGGEFDELGGASIENLGAVDAATGEVESGWNPAPDTRVRALAAGPERLFVGGDFEEFSDADGPEAAYFAALDPDTSSFDSDWSVEVENRVRALAVDGDRVYAGSTGSLQGTLNSGLGVFDRQTGARDEAFLAESFDVFAIEIAGDTLYAAGRFSFSDAETDTERDYVAAFDAETGALDEGWDAAITDDRDTDGIFGLAASANRVILAGEFVGLAGANRPDMAAVSADDGSLVEAWAHGVGAPARAAAAQGGLVYVGGEFDVAGPPSSSAVAALDAETGRLAEGFEAPHIHDGDEAGTIHALDVSGDRLYVGGRFDAAGDLEGVSTALSLDAETGAAHDDWLPQQTEGLYTGDLIAADDRVYVVGRPSGAHYGKAPETRGPIAALDKAAGEVIPEFDVPHIKGENHDNVINKIALAGDRVFALGQIEEVEGSAFTFEDRAAFSVTDGDVLAWVPKNLGGGDALDAGGDYVYTGSDINAVDAEAVLGPETPMEEPAWSLEVEREDQTATRRPNDHIRAGDRLYVAGNFDLVAGEHREELAAIDVDAAEDEGELAPEWTASTWHPRLSFTGSTEVLAAPEGAIFVGGQFTRAAGSSESEPVSRAGLALFDRESGDRLW